MCSNILVTQIYVKFNHSFSNFFLVSIAFTTKLSSILSIPIDNFAICSYCKPHNEFHKYFNWNKHQSIVVNQHSYSRQVIHLCAPHFVLLVSIRKRKSIDKWLSWLRNVITSLCVCSIIPTFRVCNECLIVMRSLARAPSHSLCTAMRHFFLSFAFHL